MILAWLLTWRERRQRRRRALDLLVLGLVQRLEPNAYGVTLRWALEQEGFHWSIGTIYVALWRLERRGEVYSTRGGATPERGGRHKLLWHLTVVGRRALADIDAA